GELYVRVNDSPGSSHTVTFDPAKIPARPSFVMSVTLPPRMYTASRTKSLFVYVHGDGPMVARDTPSGLKPLFSYSREVPANRFAFPIAPSAFPVRSFIATRTFVAPPTIPRPWACVLAGWLSWHRLPRTMPSQAPSSRMPSFSVDEVPLSKHALPSTTKSSTVFR